MSIMDSFFSIESHNEKEHRLVELAAVPVSVHQSRQVYARPSCLSLPLPPPYAFLQVRRGNRHIIPRLSLLVLYQLMRLDLHRG
jgi:hypothetical protein